MITYLTHGHVPSGFPDSVELRDTYELDGLPATCRLLLIGLTTDHIHLTRHRRLLEDFLGRGGTLVIGGGHVLTPIFEGAPLWQKAPSPHQVDLDVVRVAQHPVWQGINAEELSVRRGVRGFYGRGGYPELRDGDVVINTVQDLPVDVELRRAGGRVLLHGGNDMWGFGVREEPGTGIRDQLLRWGTEEWT